MIILTKILMGILAICWFFEATSYFSGKVQLDLNNIDIKGLPSWANKDDIKKYVEKAIKVIYVIKGIISLFLIYIIFFVI